MDEHCNVLAYSEGEHATAAIYSVSPSTNSASGSQPPFQRG
ncbi:hypothetical protein PS854_02199 [Pseudomonas fluorescens]|uniref:Uncharacterized protein n=1 Tax=Pseudomonas fluorescens TaxID=294 RepID=A0A5E7JJ55_PSEFL|nr:hypothetical protein PS854_02199 [Pseudomonas fluorescens]